MRVPAKIELVETFYRKALDADGQDVRGGEGPPDSEGARQCVLKGRKSGLHTQVSVRQLPGTLDARVQIISRVWD
jgi:hypothetical protein